MIAHDRNDESCYKERNQFYDMTDQLPIIGGIIIMTRQTISCLGTSPATLLSSHSKTVRLMQCTRLIDSLSTRCTRVPPTPKSMLTPPKGEDNSYN
jgi:hypothetical protein